MSDASVKDPPRTAEYAVSSSPAVSVPLTGFSGKMLFAVTLGAAVTALVGLVLSSYHPNEKLAVGITVVWGLFVIVLLYQAGVSISSRNDPGVAAMTVVLALLLSGLVYSATVGSMALSLSLAEGQASEIQEAPGSAGTMSYAESDILDALAEMGVSREDLWDTQFAEFWKCMDDRATTLEDCAEIVGGTV